MTKIPCHHTKDGRMLTTPLSEHLRIPMSKTVAAAGLLEQPARHEWNFPVPPLLTAALHPEDVDVMSGLQPEVVRYRLVEHGIRVWRVARISRCEECDEVIEHGSYLDLSWRTLDPDEDYARAKAEAARDDR